MRKIVFFSVVMIFALSFLTSCKQLKDLTDFKLPTSTPTSAQTSQPTVSIVVSSLSYSNCTYSIGGTLANNGNTTVIEVRIAVDFYDGYGNYIGANTFWCPLRSPNNCNLTPNEKCNFFIQGYYCNVAYHKLSVFYSY